MTSIDRGQRWRGTLTLSLITLLLLSLGGRLIYIHKVDGEFLRARAINQRHSVTAIPARRGMIFDARGRVVALSRERPDVYVDPSLVKDVPLLAERLAARLNINASDIARKIYERSTKRYVVIARSVDEVAAESMTSLKHAAVGLTWRSHRYYPLGTSMAHVLGWVGFEGYGLSGVELSYNDHLAGRDGQRGTIRDARRRAMDRRDTTSQPPIDGGHLVLTLDAEIQRMAEEALAESIEKFEAQSGVILAMSPQTGDILAMASLPSFDPNQPYTLEDADLRRNRVLTDPVEPGSTFKLVIAAAALEGGYLSTTEKIDCKMGRHRFGSRTIHDTKPHGLLDIRGIITHSSNIGMGLIAHRMGNEALYEAVRRFGFGQRTGLDCRGESSGLVYPLKRWTSYSTTSIPIGYEILVTPIQLLNAFAALINDGVQLQPRLVKSVLGPDGSCVRCDLPPQPIRRVTSEAIARFITHDLLVSVVKDGGGYRADRGTYRVLGKTGTTKLTYVDRPGYEDGAYLGLFVGAAPADDPQIVALAIVRRPNCDLGYYGGKIAAPAVGKLLEGALSYWGVPPDKTNLISGL